MRVEDPHSYEAFASRPFYVAVDSYTISKAPVSKRVVDFGSGTGAIIERLDQQGKLASDATVVAVDIDQSGLQAIRRKNFQGKLGNIDVVRGSVDNVPLREGWADLVTFCNSIHLINNPADAISEAYKVLGDDGTLIINSAYEKIRGYGNTQSKRMLGIMNIEARKTLIQEGYKKEIPAPIELANYAAGDFVNMAIDKGFSDVSVEIYPAIMDREDVRAIFSYKDFVEGSLPGVPWEIAREALRKTVDPQFDKRKINGIKRNWMILVAKKKGNS